MGYILSLALLLRLVLINQSLWLDESIEALALMGKMGPLMTYALADYQPPLYHLVGFVVTQLLGFSEIALRIPSLISGLGTVYFVIKIGEFLAGKKVGQVAGLLVATNPLLIYYAQEGRTYAMTTFFVTASYYYFLKLLQSPKTSHYTLYTLFTTLFLWTSYLSWFVLLAQGVYVLYKKRYDLLLWQSIAAITLIAWLPSFIASVGIGRDTIDASATWGQVVGGLNWKSLPLTWVKFTIGRIGFDNKMLYAGLVGCLGLTHLAILRRVHYHKYLPILVWIIPPVILGLCTAAFLPVYSYFRVLFVLPAYLLLLAIGSTRLSRTVVVLNLLFLAVFWFSPRYHKEDWRSLVSDLPTSAQLSMPSRAQSAPLRYYSWDDHIIEPSHEPIQGSPIYYIRYAEDLFDASRQGQANLGKAGYTITSQKSYPGIQLDIYENSD